MPKSTTELDKIVIRNVQTTTKITLTNIAKNKGTTVTALLRRKIVEIINAASEAEKKNPIQD